MEGLPETDRLLFRHHKMDDLDAYCRLEADPDFRQYVGGKPRRREEAERRFMPSLVPVTNGLSMWAAVYKPENKYIGRCGIYPHFDHGSVPFPGEASFGIYLDKTYWGRGLATEAGMAFIEYGFNELNLNKIVTVVQVGNIASVKVIEKLGFRLTYTEEGRSRSFYRFELLASAFKKD